MNLTYLSSRHGFIKEIQLYEYRINRNHFGHDNRKIKDFVHDIIRNQQLPYYYVDASYFSLFQELEHKTTKEYSYEKMTTISPPFKNTQVISQYIGTLLRNNFATRFNQYLRTNTFSINENLIDFISLNNCFEFNVEVFENGEYFIHLLPTTKISSSISPITFQYLNQLKTRIPINTEEKFELSLIELNNKRLKINLAFHDFISRNLKMKLENEQIKYATFNYLFLASIAPETFQKTINQTLKKLNDNARFINDPLKQIDLPKSFGLDSETFFKTELFSLVENNLMTGRINDRHQLSSKQSACHFNGVYQPVNNKTIIPIVFGNLDLKSFKDRFHDLNKEGLNCTIADPILLNSNDEIGKEHIELIKKTKQSNTIVCIFTQFQLPTSCFEQLKLNKIKFQTYLGNLSNTYAEKAKLSNFTCKIIDKLGGIITLIKDSGVPNTTYYLGIDLGHSINLDKKQSILGLVLFSSHGEFLCNTTVSCENQNEHITLELFESALCQLKNVLKQKAILFPESLVIHRDGRVHQGEIDIFKETVLKILSIKRIDVLEIIKSGFPLLMQKEYKDNKSTGNVLNPETGSYYLNKENKYAILVTNTQVSEFECSSRPLIIKQKYGETNFQNLVKGVYWLTLVYTNNLYYSTRLPATTLKANNTVSTSNKIHEATYKG